MCLSFKHVDVNLSISTILGVCMEKNGVEGHISEPGPERHHVVGGAC